MSNQKQLKKMQAALDKVLLEEEDFLVSDDEELKEMERARAERARGLMGSEDSDVEERGAAGPAPKERKGARKMVESTDEEEDDEVAEERVPTPAPSTRGGSEVDGHDVCGLSWFGRGGAGERDGGDDDYDDVFEELVEPVAQEGLEEARGRQSSGLVDDEEQEAQEEEAVIQETPKRDRVVVARSSIVSPIAKKAKDGFGELVRNYNKEIEREQFLTRPLDDTVVPESGIFINPDNAKLFLANLKDEQRELFTVCEVGEDGAKGRDHAVAFLDSLSMRQKMEFEDAVTRENRDRIGELEPGMSVPFKVPQRPETDDMKKIRWIEMKRREDVKVEKQRKKMMDTMAVAFEGALGALGLEIPGDRPQEYLEYCRGRGLGTSANRQVVAQPKEQMVAVNEVAARLRHASIDERGQIADFDLYVEGIPLELSLKEMVTSRQMEIYLQKIAGKSFMPDVFDARTHLLLCSVRGNPGPAVAPDALGEVLKQDEWREQLENGAPNPKYQERKAVMVTFVRAVEAEEWKRRDAAEFVETTLLRPLQARRSIRDKGVFRLREAMLEEFGSDAEFVMSMKAMVELALGMERFPEKVPLLKGDVRSVSLSHEQLVRFAASLFFSSNPSGFASLTKSAGALAIAKMKFWLRFARIARGTVADAKSKTVTVRLLKSSKGDFKRLIRSRSERKLPSVQCEESVDLSELGGCSHIVACGKTVGGKFFHKWSHVQEEDLAILEHPELILVTHLHPVLEEYEAVSVLGLSQYMKAEMSKGIPLVRNLNRLPGQRGPDACPDVNGRGAIEHLLLDLSVHKDKQIYKQLDGEVSDIAKLCLAMSAQEGLEDLPVVCGLVGIDGKSNEELLFVFMCIGAMFSQRPLLFHTRGSATLKSDCEALVEKMKEKAVDLGRMLDLLDQATEEVTLRDTGLLRFMKLKIEEL